MEQESKPSMAEENVSRFYGLIKSYNSFDRIEVLGVVQSLLYAFGGIIQSNPSDVSVPI
jgi:hypothetical protein